MNRNVRKQWILVVFIIAAMLISLVPLKVHAEEGGSEGENFLSNIIGEYQPLFEGATFNQEYDHYWHDYAAAVVGASAADETVAYLKYSIGGDKYGPEADPNSFFCGFIDAEKISFGGEDGRTVTFLKPDGTSVTHEYVFVKEAAATGTYGEYSMEMNGYLYQAADENNDGFEYLLMFPDTPDTTYHLEFRYAPTEEEVTSLTSGAYAYWVGSAIPTYALTEENEATLQNVISLFVVENLAEMSGEEANAQRMPLVGVWDCDFSAFPEYANAKMYIELSDNGSGCTWADFTGSGTMIKTAEYTYFAYDPDPDDGMEASPKGEALKPLKAGSGSPDQRSGAGKEAGIYIALNEEAETVTPGYYEIVEEDGKKKLIFTSQEGQITYISRGQEEPLPFTDVKEDDWFYEAVEYVYNKDIMTGMRKTVFGPAKTLSRAQFAVVLNRMNGAPEVAYSEKFPDVPEGEWYTNAVLWANSIGVVKGYQNGYYGPADPITREQMVVMMYRYAKYMGFDVSESDSLSRYPDASSVSAWAKDAVKWAVGAGIITGDGGRINPQGKVSRAVCATIIQRFCEKYEGTEEPEQTVFAGGSGTADAAA